MVAYKQTAVFDQDTIPAGLKRNHRTAPGVWAMVRIMEGRLIYRTIDPPSETLLDGEHPAVIAPQEFHEVALCGPVRFFVEFYSKPENAGRDPHSGSKDHG
ncbi:MAG TPA: DUF1971 domain-containing protein [Pararhizobium sp.]|nr:DUF1971 domain-containing protein [Pararhizobium sp.]